MMENQQDKHVQIEIDRITIDDMGRDWIEILHKIIRIRKTLYKAAGIGLIIGIVIALSIPKQFTVKVTLSPEMGSSKGNNALAGLAASFLGSGVTPGEGTDALNASLSADIISSTPFMLELLDIKVLTTSKKLSLSLKDYLDGQSKPWWNYVIKFPVEAIAGIKSLIAGKDVPDCLDNLEGTIELSMKDTKRIKYLKQNINASVDTKTAITCIYVTLQDPRVAAIVADSVVRKLQDYIVNYRTSKAKEDCYYLEKLFKERKQEYYVAQKEYADYVDTHDDLILQSVRAEQERLQNEMSLAYQVYSQVANQLQVARAKVQEEKPVFAVVEPAVVPLLSSSMGIKIYVLMFVFLAVACTASWILIGKEILEKLKKKIRNN
mgnify:CR=1 FL=1